MQPYYSAPGVELYAGNALTVLAQFPAGSVAAVITDPPYSSGGMTRSDRAGNVHAKYVSSDSSARALAPFGGDNRDQRAHGYWSALWLGEALRVTRPGGVCALFADWRQLPLCTDALQAGGWVWRGIVPWTKTVVRPQKGRFAAACEYVVWGSAGPMSPAGPCLPGWYTAAPVRQRRHIAEKPLAVMRALVRIAEPGGVVLDPFMGSGTTGAAALAEGRRFAGVELDPHFQRVAAERIRSEQLAETA